MRKIDFLEKQFDWFDSGDLMLECGYVQVRVIAKLWKLSMAGRFP